jgi:hypothetical protein
VPSANASTHSASSATAQVPAQVFTGTPVHPAVREREVEKPSAPLWWRSFLALTLYGLKQFGQCRHHKSAFSEGKVVCPDCGQSLIRRWVMLRCACCHRLRKPVYWFDAVIPGERHCTQCGTQAFYQQAVPSPLAPHHLPWAILTRQTEPAYNPAYTKTTLKRVWIETQQEAGLSPVPNTN